MSLLCSRNTFNNECTKGFAHRKDKSFMCKNCCLKALLPYFCKNYFNGSKEEIYWPVLAFIFCVGDSAAGSYLFTLALADPDHPVCDHILCTGHGYHLVLF